MDKLVIVCMIDKGVRLYDRRADEGYFIKMAVGVLTRQLIHRVSWQARHNINEHLDASKSKPVISVQPLNTQTHTSLAANPSSGSDLCCRLIVFSPCLTGMHSITGH